MTTEPTDKSPLLRFLIAAPVGEAFDGKHIALGGASSVAEHLRDAGAEFSVTVDDTMRGGGTQSVSVSMRKMSEFSLASVASATPRLAELLALSGTLTTDSGALDKLLEIIGPGPVADQIAQIVGPGQGASSGSSGTDGVDDMFDKVGKAEPNEAKRAIDSFVRGSRQGANGISRSTARKIRDLVEVEVYRMAGAVLESPEVARSESVLRGLSFFRRHCPDAARIQVSLANCDASNAASVIGSRVPDDESDAFDAIFVPTPLATSAQVTELAELGESLLCPVLVEAPMQIADGAGDTFLADSDGASAKAWQSVRENEAMRWIGVVANRIVLKVEGGSDKRVVFGSGVWSVAAQLANSYKLTGSLSYILGRPGAVQAPDVWFSDDLSLPTSTMFSRDEQKRLADLGIIGVGSGRNDTKLILSRTPTACASDNTSPLEHQIIIGRVVRFAQWVIAQLPERAPDEEVSSVFTEAARVFLLPSIGPGWSIGAGRAGEGEVLVGAKADPNVAGHALEISFTLNA